MLRHRFVTNMLDADVDLRDVQIVVCHADPRTTMRSGPPELGPPPELLHRRLRGLRHLTSVSRSPVCGRHTALSNNEHYLHILIR